MIRRKKRFDHREALEMFRSGRTTKEISEQFGVTHQAVSSAIFRLTQSGLGEIGGPTVEEMLSKCRG